MRHCATEPQMRSKSLREFIGDLLQCLDLQQMLAPWTAKGEVRVDSHDAFASRSQCRWGGNGGVARINLHHIVFTARSPEVELKLDNAAASPGEELGVNYVSLLPYYAR